MLIVFYVSGHGFGHATRELEVIRHIQQQRPGARIVIRTSVPRWFIERSIGSAAVVQACETDTGVAQIDSLRPDEVETLRRTSRFYSTFAERVQIEAAMLEDVGASVVVGDVPPLAFAAAGRAGVPSIAVANFTWDWIYEAYPLFQAAGGEVLNVIRDAYAQATQALRLPFAGGFQTMRAIEDVPLVARRSRRNRRENRQLLQLDDERPIVLASFGGHGAVLPFEQIARDSDVTLVVTDYEAAGVVTDASLNGRLRCFSGQALERADIRYEDLVGAADVVVSKPGYGIVSECIANETSLLYTSRGRFAENDVLVGAMQRVLRTQFIPQEDLRAGRWAPAIHALLDAPGPRERMPATGARVVASAIIRLADHGRL